MCDDDEARRQSCHTILLFVFLSSFFSFWAVLFWFLECLDTFVWMPCACALARSMTRELFYAHWCDKNASKISSDDTRVNLGQENQPAHVRCTVNLLSDLCCERMCHTEVMTIEIYQYFQNTQATHHRSVGWTYGRTKCTITNNIRSRRTQMCIHRKLAATTRLHVHM